MRRMLLLSAAVLIMTSTGCLAPKMACKGGREITYLRSNTLRNRGEFSPVITSNTVRRHLGQPIAAWEEDGRHCETYRFSGPLERGEDYDSRGFGWVMVFSLGLCDLYYVPKECLRHADRLSRYEMTFYYDDQGRAIEHGPLRRTIPLLPVGKRSGDP